MKEMAAQLTSHCLSPRSIGYGHMQLYIAYAELIFVTNITNYIRGETNCHVEKFQLPIQNLTNLWSFIKVYALFVSKSMWRNLCGENLCGEKMTNMRSVHMIKTNE